MLNDIEQIGLVASTRTNDLSEPLDLYLKVANELEATLRLEYLARAKFIREQCKGDNGKELFDKYREEWNINNFDEDILTVDDFKRGFLWKFRDHTTSWSDNQKAKTWFLNSPEGYLLDVTNFGLVTKVMMNALKYEKAAIKKFYYRF